MRSLTIQRTTVVLLFILLFAIAIRTPVDTDIWWHIRSAEYILDNGTINGDPFSHTRPGGEWINHSWGSQMVLYAFWQAGGNAGLAIFAAILAVGGMALLYHISAGNVYLKAFVIILGASTAAVFWSARPQMLSFFLSALLLWIIYRYKRDKKDYLWGIIPLMWVWGNVHAGWSIGYLFLIAFLVGEPLNTILGIKENTMGWAGWRKLFLATLISIPFLMISPYFVKNMLVPFNTVSIEPLLLFIQEWQSPNFQLMSNWTFIAMIMLLFLALWTSHLSFDWGSFFLLIGTLFLALLYSRNIALFAVAATPILTYHLDNALTERNLILRPRQSVPMPMAILNAVIIVVIGLGVTLYAMGLLLPDEVEEAQAKVLPVAAAEYLNEHDFPPQMFNSYNWGGYLMYASPQYQVFIDGRSDLYGDFITDYAQIYFNTGDNVLSNLQEHNVNLVVIEVSAPLNDALRASPQWTLEYEDDIAMIWIRGETDE